MRTAADKLRVEAEEARGANKQAAMLLKQLMAELVRAQGERSAEAARGAAVAAHARRGAARALLLVAEGVARRVRARALQNSWRALQAHAEEAVVQNARHAVARSCGGDALQLQRLLPGPQEGGASGFGCGTLSLAAALLRVAQRCADAVAAAARSEAARVQARAEADGARRDAAAAEAAVLAAASQHDAAVAEAEVERARSRVALQQLHQLRTTLQRSADAAGGRDARAQSPALGAGSAASSSASGGGLLAMSAAAAAVAYKGRGHVLVSPGSPHDGRSGSSDGSGAPWRLFPSKEETIVEAVGVGGALLRHTAGGSNIDGEDAGQGAAGEAMAAPSDPFFESARLLSLFVAEQRRCSSLTRALADAELRVEGAELDVASLRTAAAGARGAAERLAGALETEASRRASLQSILKRLRALHPGDVDAASALVGAAEGVVVAARGGRSGEVSWDSAEAAASDAAATFAAAAAYQRSRAEALSIELVEADGREARIRAERSQLAAALTRQKLAVATAGAQLWSLRESLAAEVGNSAASAAAAAVLSRHLEAARRKLAAVRGEAAASAARAAHAEAARSAAAAEADGARAEAAGAREEAAEEGKARAAWEARCAALSAAAGGRGGDSSSDVLSPERGDPSMALEALKSALAIARISASEAEARAVAAEAKAVTVFGGGGGEATARAEVGGLELELDSAAHLRAQVTALEQVAAQQREALQEADGEIRNLEASLRAAATADGGPAASLAAVDAARRAAVLSQHLDASRQDLTEAVGALSSAQSQLRAQNERIRAVGEIVGGALREAVEAAGGGEGGVEEGRTPLQQQAQLSSSPTLSLRLPALLAHETARLLLAGARAACADQPAAPASAGPPPPLPSVS